MGIAIAPFGRVKKNTLPHQELSARDASAVLFNHALAIASETSSLTNGFLGLWLGGIFRKMAFDQQDQCHGPNPELRFAIVLIIDGAGNRDRFAWVSILIALESKW